MAEIVILLRCTKYRTSQICISNGFLYYKRLDSNNRIIGVVVVWEVSMCVVHS